MRYVAGPRRPSPRNARRRHVLRSLVGGSLHLPGVVSDLFAADGPAGGATPSASACAAISRPSTDVAGNVIHDVIA